MTIDVAADEAIALTGPVAGPAPSAAAPAPAPGLRRIFWISLFLGPFGFLPADRAARAAAAQGGPRERYWILWLLVWATLTPVLYGVLAFGLLVGALGMSLHPADYLPSSDGGTSSVDDMSGAESYVDCLAPDGNLVAVPAEQCVDGRYTP